MSRRKGVGAQPPAANVGPGPQADGMYEIRTLLKKRRGKGGRTEYLVAWKGYDASENTWEPVTGLPGWVVQEFEDRQKGGAKNATGATKRKRPLEAARGIVRPPKKSKYTCTLPTSGYPLRGCPANMRACRTILNGLLGNELSAPFREPVDPVALNLPNYFDVVKHPMDLGTVSTRLKSSRYKEVDDFLKDCRLVWSNAMTYNEDKSNIYEMARRLRDDFERRFTTAARGFINRNNSTTTGGGTMTTARPVPVSGASSAVSSGAAKAKTCAAGLIAAGASSAASAGGSRGGAGGDSGGVAQRKKAKPPKSRGAASASGSSQSRSAQALLAEPPKLPAFLNPEPHAPDPQEAAIRRELSALAKRHSDVSLRVAGAQGRVIKSLAGCQLRGNLHNTGIFATCLKRLLDHKFSRMFHAAKCQKVLREEKAGTYSHGEEAGEVLPPLDANEILHSLHAERYETADDLMRDTRRVWSEAMLRVGEQQLVFKLAQTLSRFFDAELRRASTNLHGVEWEQKQPSAPAASASAVSSNAAVGASASTLAAAAAASAAAAAAPAPARGRARSSSFSQSAQAKRAHAVSLAQAAQAVAQHDAAEAAAAVTGKAHASSPLFLGQSHGRGRLGSAPLDTPDLYDWQATPQHSPPLGPANAGDTSPGLSFGLTGSHNPGALSLPASAGAPSSAVLGSMLPPPLPPPGSIASESGIEVEDMLHSGSLAGTVDGGHAAISAPRDDEVEQQWDAAIQPLDTV